jgi:AcrR family transcriptional regulator
VSRSVPHTRERIVTSSAELFRRQGYAATGLKQIVAAASAPFGSIYHFFPGGKEELGAQAIRWSGAGYEELLAALLAPGPDPVRAVRDAFRLAGEDLEASGWADACPIATVALEVSSTSEPLRAACADVFDSWLARGTSIFAAAGLDEAAARDVTITLVTSLEGAFVLARALRSKEPLLVAGDAVAERLRAALGAAAEGA